MAQEPSAEQRRLDLQDSRKNIEGFLSAIRPALFGNLTGDEAATYQQIEFRVTDDDYASHAGSLIEDGTRVVEVGVGYGREIEMMAEALYIEQVQNRPVLIPYIRYVALSWRQRAVFVKDPTSFAHFDPDEIDNDPQASKQLTAMTLGGLAFVLAHEVGHHVLGHYDRPLPVHDVEKLRQMELDADSWALNRLVHATPHFSPISGLLPLLFEYYTTPNPVAHETTADHPANLRRITTMFATMKADLPQYRPDVERQGASYGEFSDFIDKSLQEYRKQLQSDSPPVREQP
jgi:hypothetical protein